MPPTSVHATVTSVSWIPSEAVTGPTRKAVETFGHYDPPPPDVLDDLDALRAADGFRFANVLAGYAAVENGRIVRADYESRSDAVMGSTTVRIGPLGATFTAIALPTIRHEPEYLADGSVRLVQASGGRTAVPVPRPISRPPFVKLQAPWVWTTLALTLRPDGSSSVDLVGASAFPRHWVYDTTGALVLKSGLTDWARWLATWGGTHTPWGDEDSPALVTEAETASERLLSRILMGGAKPPRVITMQPGRTLTRQGDAGDELYLLLDGVLAVEVDGKQLAELGPGAVLGERAVLEGGPRTATLTAVTPIRVAVAPARSIDRERLTELAQTHRREETTAP